MNILGSEHIFHVFRVHPQADGSVKRQFVGRFIEHDGEVHILEDHLGVLSHVPEGPVTEETNRILDQPPPLRLHRHRDCRRPPERPPARHAPGARLLAAAGPARRCRRGPAKKQSIFEYVRDGQTHTVEFRDGQCFLDGNHLDNAEAGRLLEHHRQGVAVLRYRKDPNG
jgi:hypothetical protein